MSYTIEVKSDIPCIYAKFTGLTLIHDLINSRHDIIKSRQSHFSDLPSVYCITDFLESNSNFATIQKNVSVLPETYRCFNREGLHIVLIVEADNPWMRFSRDVLQRFGWKITSFETSEQAITYIQQQHEF